MSNKYNLRKRKRAEPEEELVEDLVLHDVESTEESDSTSSSDESDAEEPPRKRKRMSLTNLLLDDELAAEQSIILGEAKNKNIEADVIKLVKEMEADEPTLEKIMGLETKAADKKDLVLIYEIYHETLPYTLEHYELRKRLITLIEFYIKSDYKERCATEEKLSALPKLEIPSVLYEMRKKVLELHTTDATKSRILEMIKDLEGADPTGEHTRTLREKVLWALSLPYDKKARPDLLGAEIPSPDAINQRCIQLRKKLDTELYGMENVKNQIISAYVNKISNPSAKTMIALAGKPGTGKTAICIALAKAIGLPFQRIPLGSISDATALTGSMSWFVGSTPGLILRALKGMQVCDGVVLFDEIDKLSKKDTTISNALLQITDYTQNSQFEDSFLPEVSANLSSIWFLASLNNEEDIHPVLRDRLTIIKVDEYTRDDLIKIVHSYLLPRALKNVGVGENQILIDHSGCQAVIDLSYSEESGIRQTDRVVQQIVSRINTIRMVTLEDGTTGELRLGYGLGKKLELPFTITRETVMKLADPKKSNRPVYYS